MTRTRLRACRSAGSRSCKRLYPADSATKWAPRWASVTDRALDPMKDGGTRGSRGCGCARSSIRCATVRPSGFAPQLVAAGGKLGPRCGALVAPAAARAGLCRHDDWNAHHRSACSQLYTATQRILIDPMPYKDSGDLY